MAFLTGKTVLVTGGCGTVGRELVRQIVSQTPAEVRVIDSNESEIFFLEQEMDAQIAEENLQDVTALCHVGDIRDVDRLNTLFEGVDVVFHLAALKHVILCEKSPFDATQTNIIGVKNVIQAALNNNVERVIFTSSDKGVNPTNVLGTSKLMGERLITSANSLKINKRTVFSSTRFGNVLGSRGSVATVFERQIKAGGPVTLTDPEMTRFVMTLKQACSLVLEASELARGGEVFVTKMPVMRIEDLAHVMIYRLAPEFGHAPTDVEVTNIGSKAGEKFYEELMTDEETRRTWELPNMFTVLPAFRSVYQEIEYDYPTILRKQVTEPYNSATGDMMTYPEIEELLELCGVLQAIEDEEADIRPFLKRAA
ncbi:SDR family NAD(P)-dependent oxidoreductase [Fuerstiella marisgermanici]|uniref:UDP-N-acetylglucosamine 4,6-dehydratase (Inverting) n=1 Tax=Fuerstiella marisgermanici TaxID=1891926 RepID=A0A1P8WKS7_9PLAN|nr:SDR family NAD(P)-dependent oxidoreductase [Fuerstiella marisgermanici]APZ94666.1 UDP-N-acetylglucosamine 4,6-dehydratase (inverting) [Fuerstiella marisgermanici]